MTKLVNRAKMTTATTGTGAITLGSAVDGYQTFAAAGVADGDVVRYVIEDGTDWEIGTGTYTASGTTLSRTVDESSNSDNALNLTGNAAVYVSAIDADFREEAVGSTQIAGSSVLFDLSSGNVFSVNTVFDRFVSFDNPPASGTAYGFTLKWTWVFSAGTIYWPSSVQWPDGTAPDSGVAYGTNVYVFYTQDGGTTYYGFKAGSSMA